MSSQIFPLLSWEVQQNTPRLVPRETVSFVSLRPQCFIEGLGEAKLTVSLHGELFTPEKNKMASRFASVTKAQNIIDKRGSAYSTCVVYTKIIINRHGGESDGYLRPLR